MKQGKEKLREKERQQHSQIDQCDRSSADDARCQLKTVGFDLDLPLRWYDDFCCRLDTCS